MDKASDADTDAAVGAASTNYALSNSQESLHVKMWLGLPEGISRELDRDGIRETLRHSSRNLRESMAAKKVHTHWQRMSETESRNPARSTRDDLYRFSVMRQQILT